MRTIIAGSRGITRAASIDEAVAAAAQHGLLVTAVISGAARGVDRLGEHFAARNNLPLYRFPADWKRYGRRAGYRRNEEMADNADALIAVWDGYSKGTKHMIDIATDKKLRVFVWKEQL